MQQPSITWPITRASEWVEVLRNNGISVSTAAPLTDLQQKGIYIPSPDENELAFSTSVVCRKGPGVVSVVGSLSENLNPEQYLISLFWKSGWKGAKHPNSLLASQILQILTDAGARIYDPWDVGIEGKHE